MLCQVKGFTLPEKLLPSVDEQLQMSTDTHYKVLIEVSQEGPRHIVDNSEMEKVEKSIPRDVEANKARGLRPTAAPALHGIQAWNDADDGDLDRCAGRRSTRHRPRDVSEAAQSGPLPTPCPQPLPQGASTALG